VAHGYASGRVGYRRPDQLRGAAARGTHLGELWELPPTGNRVEFEFIDIFRVSEGKLIEHWTSMDLGALRHQMRAPSSP
jgi:predicted ester cyclase